MRKLLFLTLLVLTLPIASWANSTPVIFTNAGVLLEIGRAHV